MGTLKEHAQRDIKQITSNINEWADEATFEALTGERATINLLHTKHHLGIDAELQKWVNTKNAHISFSEELLTNLNYPVRNDSGQVFLQNHRVTVKDSTGNLCTYKIEQWFPDETIGLIVCILGDWEDG